MPPVAHPRRAAKPSAANPSAVTTVGAGVTTVGAGLVPALSHPRIGLHPLSQLYFVSILPMVYLYR